MIKKPKEKKETIDDKLTSDELYILKQLLETEIGRFLSDYSCDTIKIILYKIINMEAEALDMKRIKNMATKPKKKKGAK